MARNQFGQDSRILNVYVRSEPAPRPTQPPPPSQELSIRPPHYTGRPGDEVILTCHNLADVYANLVWTKDGHRDLPAHIYADNGALTIQRASVEDSGRYICSSESGQGPITQSADVYITSSNRPDPPKIKKFNDLYDAVQGSDFSLICEASGNPTPTVKWTKVHEKIDSNIQVNGNVLRILNAQPVNRGVYTCIAESEGGIAEESTVIDIERKSLL